VKLNSQSQLGQLVARALRQSWLASNPEELGLTPDEFETVTPLLYESGAAALGWWRVRETSLRDTQSAELLHQAFRLLALRARTHETRIEKLFGLFRHAHVEAMLVKGWAVARSYPAQALRPYGDVDLLVRPSDRRKTQEILSSDAARDCLVDLHDGMFEIADRPLEEVFARSRTEQCGHEQVRVPGPEDHFALLAIHFLRHAAWRPLWLCDIGMLLESLPVDFDWEICLGQDKRRANWILSAAGLAHFMLGAEIREPAIAQRALRIPPWLKDRVSQNWVAPYRTAHAPHRHHAPIKTYFRSPRGLLGDLTRRWPDPILATISVSGSFGPRRRLRYEVANSLMRVIRFALQPLTTRST
jgi:hypothetical protein